jgi:E-phenylitaconyl-CoA hydratase
VTIIYEIEAGIATITIDRPERMNALNPTAMVDLRNALLRFDVDPAVRVGIITGAGNRAFCAGADIYETGVKKPFAPGFFDREIHSDHPLYVRNISFQRLNISKPLIAAVNGVAVGGGMEIALNCDLCISSSTASFGLTEVCIGSIPAVAGIQRLMHSLPRAAAMKFLMTGEIIDAGKALELGIVSEIVSPELLMERARQIGALIVANAPLSVKAVKYLAEKAHNVSLLEAAAIEELLWGHLYTSNDRIEGRKAFVEKRTPVFTGQ